MHPTALKRAAGIVVTAAGLLGPAAVASAAPRNDDLNDAIPVQVGSNVNGNVNGATQEAREPRHAESAAQHSVWYRFRAGRKVTVLFATCRANFDTVVAVYSGGEVTSLRPVDFNNDGCGRDSTGSRVSFTARPGTTYQIAVAGFKPEGRFKLAVSRINAPPNDDFFYAAPIQSGSEGPRNDPQRDPRVGRATARLQEADLTVWFRLRRARQRRVVLHTCGSRFDTVLAVYTGRRVDRLRRVTSNDDN